jgi:hypothetical protein
MSLKGRRCFQILMLENKKFGIYVCDLKEDPASKLPDLHSLNEQLILFH